MGDVSSIPFAALQPVENSPHLIKLEAVTLAGGTITFTRGGVDLTEYNGQVDTEQHLVLVTGGTTSCARDRSCQPGR
jgi:hypothetical protein